MNFSYISDCYNLELKWTHLTSKVMDLHTNKRSQNIDVILKTGVTDIKRNLVIVLIIPDHRRTARDENDL